MANTAEEVWQMLGQLAQSQQQADLRLQETERILREQSQETKRRVQELERVLREQSQESDRRFQELERVLREQSQETDRRFQETDRRFQETDLRFQETDRRFQETDRQVQGLEHSVRELDRTWRERSEAADRRMENLHREIQANGRQIRELGKQIGGLGSKFGSFTEGLALASMERILRQQFGMNVISPRVRVRRDQREMEIDVLAYSNGDRNSAYVVEVKSHPREDAIAQLKNILDEFPLFFPEHRHKSVYGILVAVDLPQHLRQRILAEGLYVARINDEVFTLDVPKDFRPRIWSY